MAQLEIGALETGVNCFNSHRVLSLAQEANLVTRLVLTVRLIMQQWSDQNQVNKTVQLLDTQFTFMESQFNDAKFKINCLFETSESL